MGERAKGCACGCVLAAWRFFLLVSLRFFREGEGEEAQRRRSTMNLITTGKNFCVLFMSPLPSVNSQKVALPYFFFFSLLLLTFSYRHTAVAVAAHVSCKTPVALPVSFSKLARTSHGFDHIQ